MKDGLVYLIGGRNDYSKEIVFENAENWDFIVNRTLHDELTNVVDSDSIEKWVENVEEVIKEKLSEYGPFIELYIDVEGIGTVWLIPAITHIVRSIYDDEEFSGVFISLIDFDGDNYTCVPIKKFI
nr:MAG TPA: hypothetical protein [Caudoviricetes sp.]